MKELGNMDITLGTELTTWNKSYEELISRKAQIVFEIEYQKTLEPEEISAKKPLSFDARNNPTSWKEIKRSEYIKILEDEFEVVNAKLNILKKLINDGKRG